MTFAGIGSWSLRVRINFFPNFVDKPYDSLRAKMIQFLRWFTPFFRKPIFDSLYSVSINPLQIIAKQPQGKTVRVFSRYIEKDIDTVSVCILTFVNQGYSEF